MFDLHIPGTAEKTTQLPEYEKNLLDDVLNSIEKDGEFIGSRLIEIFNQILGVKRIILVARQGVPIGYGLLAIYEFLGIKPPEISIITTSSSKSNPEENRKPVVLGGDEDIISKDIFGSEEKGDKVFIDEISSYGSAEFRLLALAKELDNESKYKFITFYGKNTQSNQIAPWDIKIESAGKIEPSDPMFISVCEYLSLSQGKKQKNVSSSANIMAPTLNSNPNSIIMSRAIASKMYAIGLAAAKRMQ